jgi:YidC/Oxa1 family membrane protein insertase
VAVDLSQIPEKIGYLKSLGLDYGWGPSAMMETLLESIHIYTGLPWWASTMVAALAIRLALFKTTLIASDTSVKLNQVKPLVNPIRARMLQCVREGDNFAAMKAKQELTVIHEIHGLKPWKGFLPLLHLPLGFGCFRVLTGISSLPVPGLYSESLLWITDLTTIDPFFILPLSTGVFMHLTLKVGSDPL